METVITNSISHKVANIVIAVFILRLEMLVNHSAVHVNVQAVILYHFKMCIRDRFIEGFKNAFGIHSPSTVMADLATDLMDGLLNKITELMPNVVGKFSELKESISTKWEEIKQNTSSKWEEIQGNLSAAWSKLKETAGVSFDAIKEKKMCIRDRCWKYLSGASLPPVAQTCTSCPVVPVSPCARSCC